MFSQTSGIGAAGVIAQSPNVKPGSLDPADFGTLQRPVFAGGSIARDAPERGVPPGGRPNLKSEITDPQVWAHGIRIVAVGGYLEFSFDGSNVHGRVDSAIVGGNVAVYNHRHEAGIAVRGTATTFYVEAW